MALTEKYQSLIDIARQQNINDLSVQEAENVLHVSGTAPSEEAKKRVWDEYSRLDPDMRSGDVVLNIAVVGGGAAAQAETYTVKSGDSLSKIAQNYGVKWQDIFEANRDQIKDPDMIHPGQQLRIPGK
jgi:nucleoid-associated protein YgaU